VWSFIIRSGLKVDAGWTPVIIRMSDEEYPLYIMPVGKIYIRIEV